DGTNRTKILEDTVEHLNITQGWIFYWEGGQKVNLHRVKTDGTNKQKVK
ncbi:DUF5050 domain-containing protein, partial [Brevibacillus halotolerans]